MGCSSCSEGMNAAIVFHPSPRKSLSVVFTPPALGPAAWLFPAPCPSGFFPCLDPHCTHFYFPQLLPNPSALLLAQHCAPSLPFSSLQISRGFPSHPPHISQSPCVFPTSPPGSGSPSARAGHRLHQLPRGKSCCGAVSRRLCHQLGHCGGGT